MTASGAQPGEGRLQRSQDDYCKSSKEVVELLKQAGLEFILLRRVQEHMVWLVNHVIEVGLVPTPKFEFSQYVYDFISGGIFLILMRWLEEGCIHSPETMANMVVDFLIGIFTEGAEMGSGLIFKKPEENAGE